MAINVEFSKSMNSPSEGLYVLLCSVYICSLSMKLNLKEVLSKAEELFYKYCRLAVIRGFNEVEL